MEVPESFTKRHMEYGNLLKLQSLATGIKLTRNKVQPRKLAELAEPFSHSTHQWTAILRLYHHLGKAYLTLISPLPLCSCTLTSLPLLYLIFTFLSALVPQYSALLFLSARLPSTTFLVEIKCMLHSPTCRRTPLKTLPITCATKIARYIRSPDGIAEAIQQ